MQIDELIEQLDRCVEDYWGDLAVEAAQALYDIKTRANALAGVVERANMLRAAIIEAGVKRTPRVYEAVMRFDAAQPAQALAAYREKFPCS